MHEGNGLRVLYTNSDQFVNKRDDLCMLISGSEPDLIFITEVIPKAQVMPIAPALLELPGFTMYCNFDPGGLNLGRSGKRGICMYVSTTLKATQVYFPDCPFEEQMWLQLPLTGSDRLLLGCIYRSPSGTGQDVDDLVQLLEHAVTAGNSHMFVSGDFNMPQIDWELGRSVAPEGHYTHRFVHATQDLFLHQHVLEPTRFRQGETAHTLDLIFTNEMGMAKNLQYCPGLGCSDHVVICLDLMCYSARQESQDLRLNFNRANFDKLNEQLLEADWRDDENMTIEERYNTLKTTLTKFVEKSVPMARPKSKKKNLYINRAAIKLKKKKRALWQVYQHSQDAISYAQFTRCRNQLRKMTRRLRKDFEQSLASSVKKTPKAFWRYANSRMKTRSTIGNLRNADGSVASIDADKANTLNRFFSSTFVSENTSTIPVLPDASSDVPALETVDFPTHLVEQKLASLRPSSSPGPDGLHPRLLAATAVSLAPHWAKIFKESMESGHLPKEWKAANVTPIFKKGDKQLPGNYRPISLTAIPCKVMESIIRDELMTHLIQSDQLHEAQHGFRPKRSCATQLLSTLDDWSKMVENGDSVDAVFLDFSKAFDSVPHMHLLRKLQQYGVSGRLLNWIEAFLVGRQQRVVVNGCASDWVAVTSGVPQGSVLGPLLFILYVNDLPAALQCPIKLFADDAKIYQSASRVPSDGQVLQTDLDVAVAWSTKWLLPFNKAKCSTLHFGRANARTDFSMQGTILKSVTVERDLGILVDSDLKFREQAASAVSKASQILAVIRRSFQLLDRTTLPLLFKTLVRPHLEYGNVAWGPFNRADQKLVERVQRRATRLVEEIRTEPYAERLRLLGLPSLYYRRRRGDMITVFQLLHGGVDLDPALFFTLSSTSTRGHQWKISKPEAVTRIRRNSFAVRVVNDWNALPNHVVSAATVNQFKARLDSHWAHLQYTVPHQD